MLQMTICLRIHTANDLRHKTVCTRTHTVCTRTPFAQDTHTVYERMHRTHSTYDRVHRTDTPYMSVYVEMSLGTILLQRQRHTHFLASPTYQRKRIMRRI